MKAKMNMPHVNTAKPGNRSPYSKSSINSPLISIPKSPLPEKKSRTNPVKSEIYLKREGTRHKTQLSGSTHYSALLSPNSLDNHIEYDDTYEKNSVNSNKSNEIEKIVNKETLQSAIDCLREVRIEAKECLNASKKIIQNATKFRRASLGSEDFKNFSYLNSSEGQIDLVKELAESIIELKNRINESECKSQVHVHDDETIKAAVQNLKNKIEEKNSTTLDTSSVKIGCTNNCLII